MVAAFAEWSRAMRALTFAVAIVFPLACACGSAEASVFKCDADKGGVVYQDVPCGAGRELRNFDTDPPALTVIPASPATAAPAAPAASARRSERADKSGHDSDRQQADDRRAGERKFVRSGMSEGEVLRRLGRPDVTSGDRRSGRRWAYLPRPGDPDTMTTLTLQGGNVVDVGRKVVR
jgi:hypothetical protein